MIRNNLGLQVPLGLDSYNHSSPHQRLGMQLVSQGKVQLNTMLIVFGSYHCSMIQIAIFSLKFVGHHKSVPAPVDGVSGQFDVRSHY